MIKKPLRLFLILPLLGLIWLAPAKATGPTEEREWHSTAGTTLRATAMQMKPTVVQFKTRDERLITVTLDDLKFGWGCDGVLQYRQHHLCWSHTHYRLNP